MEIACFLSRFPTFRIYGTDGHLGVDLAVAENEDTEKGLSDFVPFKNLFNEWFAKDTSRKVKAAFKAKFATGQRIGAYPSSFTAIATKIATFSYSPPQLRRR